MSGAQVACDPTDRHLAITGVETVNEDVRRKLWQAATTAAKPAPNLFDPDGDLEAYHRGASPWSIVIGPDKPSATWFEAVTVVERFSPIDVEVVIDDSASALAVRDVFAKARKKLAGEAEQAGAGEEIAEQIVYAQLAAPSLIHFIRKWSDQNRRYVRKSYWSATTTAKQDVERAQRHLVLGPGAVSAGWNARRPSHCEWRREVVADDFSGAICFAPGFYEFELPKKAETRRSTHWLKHYSEPDENCAIPVDRPLLRRRLFSNSLVLLRGEGYYANLKQTPPWDRAQDYVIEAKALTKLFRKLLAFPEGSIMPSSIA